MRNPIISIVLPTYNRASMIGNTIYSLCRQTFPDFELIVINDGSTDDTDGVILNFIDNRIRYKIIDHTDNYGINALNYGMALAKGEYLTMCSSDNLYFSNFLKILLGAMDETEADLVFGDFLDNDKENQFHLEFRRPPHLGGEFSIEHLAVGYTIGICFLFKREIFEKVKPYRVSPNSDYDLVARMAIKGAKLHHIDSILGVNVLHRGQTSKMDRSLEEESKIRLMVCDHLDKIKHPGRNEFRRKALEHDNLVKKAEK